ncbi:3537_t:CDS:1, partial [Ambispora leptoticha]
MTTIVIKGKRQLPSSDYQQNTANGSTRTSRKLMDQPAIWRKKGNKKHTKDHGRVT